jgi:competence protein ComEC
MSLERVTLFDARSFGIFLLLLASVAFFSLGFEYASYKKLKTYNDTEIDAYILNQYLKVSKNRTYSVLKLQYKNHFFYTTAPKELKNLRGREIRVELFTQKLTFLNYLKAPYLRSSILHVKPELSTHEKLYNFISSKHKNITMQELHGALFLATPMSKELREKLSALGVSHLLAISGFHLGVISFFLLMMLSPIYRFFQKRYFPYRNIRRDIFIIISLIILSYLLFLGWIPSLIRSFVMMIVGFILYDRHIKIISMQTLILTLLILLSLWPRLFFSVGFWLSISGVYVIFLFLTNFKHLKKWQIFALLPFWVYILMLPFSLVIFKTFSILHPLSILYNFIFLLFYPLSIILHVTPYADIFDLYLLKILGMVKVEYLGFGYKTLLLHVSFLLLALRYRLFLWLALIFAGAVFIRALYEVAQF